MRCNEKGQLAFQLYGAHDAATVIFMVLATSSQFIVRCLDVDTTVFLYSSTSRLLRPILMMHRHNKRRIIRNIARACVCIPSSTMAPSLLHCLVYRSYPWPLLQKLQLQPSHLWLDIRDHSSIVKSLTSAASARFVKHAHHQGVGSCCRVRARQREGQTTVRIQLPQRGRARTLRLVFPFLPSTERDSPSTESGEVGQLRMSLVSSVWLVGQYPTNWCRKLGEFCLVIPIPCPGAVHSPLFLYNNCQQHFPNYPRFNFLIKNFIRRYFTFSGAAPRIYETVCQC